MKHFKRIFALLLAAVLLVSVLAIPASAYKITTNSDALIWKYKGYKEHWEYTRTYSKDGIIIGYMTYGFDTDWIDEDYVWTKGIMCSSCSYLLRRGYDTVFVSDTDPDDPAKRNCYSKTERTHKKDEVYYNVDFYEHYSYFEMTTLPTAHK